MSAIVLDASKVNSYVLPSLTKSENFMQKAYSASVSLKNNLPSSFNKRSAVNEIVNQIYSLKKEINNIDKIIENKIELAKKIELKSESRINSISQQASKIGSLVGIMGGAAIGATTGGIVGAAVGAAVGGHVSNTLGKTIIDTGTKIVKSFVSGVKKIFTNAVNFVKNTSAKIAKGIKSIWSKFSGTIKNLGNKVVNATKSIGKAIYNTGAKIVKKTVSAAKKIGNSIINGFKWVGSKVVSGVKTAAEWVGNAAKTAGEWVGDKFNKAKDWVCQAAKNTGAWICNAGTTIWNGLKTAWNWATDIENWKKVGASVMNATLSFVKGVVSLVESIGDFAVIVGSGISTIGTALFDIGKGIVTGKWDWSATNGLWDGTKGVVAYNWTNALDKSLGWRQYFDKWAYAPFKSDGIACQITEGVGYVAGTIALTVATFGVGGVATGAATSVSAGVSATTLAATATAAGMGKYTAEEWNKNSISLNYGGTNINIAIDYNTYLEIEKLKQGESTTITQNLMDAEGNTIILEFKITSKGNGQYDIIDSNGNFAIFNSLNESNTAKGLAIGSLKAAWEGAQYYVGGKIGAGEFTKITGKVTSPVLKKVAISGIRVGLDTATGVVEVPFQSLVTMMSEGKTWDEAWKSQGGWDAVKLQAGIAGISSFAGEAFQFKGDLNAEKKLISNECLNTEEIPAKLDLKKNLDNTDYDNKLLLLKEREKLELKLNKLMENQSLDSSVKSLDSLSKSQQLLVETKAKQIYEKAITIENGITKIMKNLQDDSCHLEGLDFRVKSLESIEDKIARKVCLGYDIQTATSEINDSLRYTLIVDAQNYQDSVLSKLSLLNDQGYEIQYVNNAWGGSTYQGLNTTLKSPDNLLMELQFHTEASFNVKQNLNHKFYEISRNSSISSETKNISNKIQEINQKLYVETVNFKFDESSLKSAVINYKTKTIQVDLTPMDSGKTAFDIAKENNPDAISYLFYDDYELDTADAVKEWQKRIQAKEYIDPITGNKYTLEDVVRGYIGEDASKPGNYYVLNSVNRAWNEDPTKILENLYHRDINGNVIVDSLGRKEIVFYGIHGSEHIYIYDPLTDLLEPKGFTNNLLPNGQNCTFNQLLTRVESETLALKLALDLNPAKKPMILSRGAGWDSLNRNYGINPTDTAEQIYSKLTKAGTQKTFVDDGFMSSSPSQDAPYTKSMPVKYIMTTKENASIGNFTTLGLSFEKEVLVPAGTKFDITAIKKGQEAGKDVVYIFLTQQ